MYSLGAVLFEGLAGCPPFVRDSQVSVLWAHVNQPVPAVSELRPELPAEVDRVIAKALAKRSDERYPSCTALVEAVRSALGLPGGSTDGTGGRLIPRALEHHCRAVLDEMIRGRLVVVLGTGSAAAGAREAAESGRSRAPAEDEVASRLAERFGYPLEGVCELPRVSQYAEVLQGSGPLRDELHDIFAVDYQPGRVHDLLATVPALLRARGAPSSSSSRPATTTPSSARSPQPPRRWTSSGTSRTVAIGGGTGTGHPTAPSA